MWCSPVIDNSSSKVLPKSAFGLEFPQEQSNVTVSPILLSVGPVIFTSFGGTGKLNKMISSQSSSDSNQILVRGAKISCFLQCNLNWGIFRMTGPD